MDWAEAIILDVVKMQVVYKAMVLHYICQVMRRDRVIRTSRIEMLPHQ